MGINIPTFYVQQYSNNVQLKLQQEGSVLRSAVTMGSHVGKQASPVDQYGAISARKVSGRFGPMGRVDAPTDRRWVSPVDYDLPQLYDTLDQLRLLTDPKSQGVKNAVNALGRSMDTEILNGFYNANKTDETAGTSTSFSSSNKVSVLQGAASANNLTVAKLKEAKRLLMSYNVDVRKEEIYCAVNAKAHDSLLDEIQITSTDFNGGESVLKEGLIMRFLGINFIHTELVQSGTDDQSGTSDLIPVWCKSGLYLGMWQDFKTSMSTRHDLQNEPLQAYVRATFGGTRLEENKCIQIYAR